MDTLNMVKNEENLKLEKAGNIIYLRRDQTKMAENASYLAESRSLPPGHESDDRLQLEEE